MDSLETLQEIKTASPLIEVIMLTGHATIELAIDGMKLGAFDFLMKPSEIDVLVTMALWRPPKGERACRKDEGGRETGNAGRVWTVLLRTSAAFQPALSLYQLAVEA